MQRQSPSEKPRKGENLTILNGKTIEPRPEAILIASESRAIGLGGVMGGEATEVDETTKNIILEVANFDMYSIRRTSMFHGIFTDAVTRFNKGQSAQQNDRVLEEAVALIQSLSGGHVASDVIDDNHADSSPRVVDVSADFVNQRLGLNISSIDMKTLLENVEFGVDESDGKLRVSVPFWRTDIEINEDIVEEVGRLYGYDHVPLELPRRSLIPPKQDKALSFKKELRSILASAGAHEVLTYSFVHGNLLDKVGQQREHSYKLSNALSPDLQYFRQSLTPSLLDKIHTNIKSGFDNFVLFEMNKVHLKDERTVDEPDVPTEFERLALVFAANEKATKNYSGAAYYQARKYLDHLISAVGLSGSVRFDPLDPESYAAVDRAKISQHEASRAATMYVGDVVLGEIGEYKQSVQKSLKLPAYIAGFELDLSILRGSVASSSTYVALSRFPSVVQDMTLRVPADVSHATLWQNIQQTLGEIVDDTLVSTLQTIGIYQPNDDHKQFSLRLTIASYERTLKAEEVNSLLDSVAVKAHEACGAERI